MGKKSKSKKETIFIFVGFGVVILGFIVMSLGILWLDNDDERLEDASRAVFIVGMIIIFSGIIPLIIFCFKLMGKSLSNTLKYTKSKESKAHYNLYLYATKNGRYIYKFLQSSKYNRVDYRDYNKNYFSNSPKDMTVHIYDREWIEENKGDLDILDARLIHGANFMEIKFDYGMAYLHISLENEYYELFILNNDEVARRDEFNAKKINFLTVNPTTIEFMDELIEEVEKDNRLIKKDFDSDMSMHNLMEEIEAILDNYK